MSNTAAVLAPIIERSSLPVLIQRRATISPDAIAIECVDGEDYTNRRLHDEALRLAHGLQRLGVCAGETVAVMLTTDPTAHLAWLGITWLRALEVPVNPEFRGNSLRHILNDSTARILITTEDQLDNLTDVLPDTSVQHIILVGQMSGRDVPGTTITPFDELLTHGPLESAREPKPSDTYSVIYTSGTTGAPKGVVTPWANLHSASQQTFPPDARDVGPAGAYYCPWPTFHSGGKMGLYYAALVGMRVVMRRKFSVSSFWTDIRTHRCTHAHLIGMASTLMAMPEKDDDTDNPLRWVLMNPMPPDYRTFETRFGVRVSTGWGMTEIGFPVSTFTPPNHLTCGRLAPDYEARLVDEDDYDVPAGSAGEMVIRTREPWLLMESYLGRPTATVKAWRNGWLHTGDILRRDDDGYYYFVDRASDYIRTRGNNVSSLEVESEAHQHPAVASCACVGVASNLSDVSAAQVATDQEIKLYVQLTDQATLTENELLHYLTERMPKYMVPKQIEFVPDMPRTPTGKIQKSRLRQQNNNLAHLQ